ncbi:MAG TPA: tetratricopeptide repeat protein [Polyangiaceae bacterium]
MSAHDHRPNPEDLSALSRRGMLSEADELELVRTLADDPTVGAAHTVGLDFDRSTAVRAGDEALVARVADRALARVAASGLSPERPSRKRPRQLAALLAAALISVTGAAAGVWFGVAPVRWFGSSEPHQRSIPAEKAPPATKKLASKPPAEPPADPEKKGVEAGSESAANPAVENGADVPPRARPNRGGAESTAAELFRAGNAARHAADFPRAKRLYSELIQKYPTSEEASVARVSLGKLLLAKGDTTAAEHEFRQYLKSGRGQLAEEALVSRAHSLQKLGRTDAERTTWQQLLADYPDTVYSAEAEARLRVLGRGE